MRKILFLFPFLLAVLFYLPIFFYGFSQDDFIHLNASKANNFGDFLNFFNPFFQFPDIFFFRPLSTQLYFFLNNSLFGYNPIPYHTEALILHITNGFLFYLIVNKIWKNKLVATLSAFFYSISAIHFLSLFYISSFQQILRTFFIFLSIFFYLRSPRHSGAGQNQVNYFYIASLISFTAALLSKEISIILPLLLPLIDILKNPTEKIFNLLKSKIKLYLPFFGVALTYIIIRALGFQTIFKEGNYNLTTSLPEILQNFRWYTLWTFGLPEILSSYPSIKPSSLFQFTKDFSEGGIILGLFTLFIILILIVILNAVKDLLRMQGTSSKLKRLLICLIFFKISLLPVLFLHQHKYPQYLDLAFLGILPLIALLISKTKKSLAIIIILTFISLQFFSLKLSEQTHWTTHRAKIATHYYQQFKNTYSNPKENSEIILIGFPQQTQEVSHALAEKYAFLVWYPGKIKDVQYLNNEEQIKSRQNTILYFLDRY